MATSKYAINGAHIECSLCINVFVDPRMLPCGHTFCLQCIKAQVAKSSSTQSSVLCSLCRQLCKLPDGDARKLPKNYSLAAVTSEAKQDTSSFTSAAAVDAKFMCKMHTDQKIMFYCKDCKVLACAVCGLISHSKHTCIEASDADKEFKKIISVVVEIHKKAIATYSQNINDYTEKLHKEQAQLVKIRGQLAQYEGLLNSNDVSFIERQAAVKTLPQNQTLQLQSNPQQKRAVIEVSAYGVGNSDEDSDDITENSDEDSNNITDY